MQPAFSTVALAAAAVTATNTPSATALNGHLVELLLLKPGGQLLLCRGAHPMFTVSVQLPAACLCAPVTCHHGSSIDGSAVHHQDAPATAPHAASSMLDMSLSDINEEQEDMLMSPGICCL